ncbi:hypothetical protein [Streptomyces colonosanans]|uniref:Uncharacterized protein n=1 Tax=Streptomyces colonosanans TaxID=1428652 RepID=A0A1S2PNM5_9ACTN|nr:hypothetical protein [Streptomyces colonosanans]OIJ95401.1 hypothetical protein BIV24_08960 [Streptomyces colonosanans]
MRHNGRAPIKASTMRPEHLSLRDNEPRLAVCPDCHTWHRLTRSMITPHRDGGPDQKTERRYYGDKPSGGRRCPGSAQRVDIDITPEAWGEKLLAAETTAASRRTTRPIRKPRPQAAPATSQMSSATRSAREQLAEHLQDDCARCRRFGSARCTIVIQLRQRMHRATHLAATASATPLYGQLRTALHQHRATCTPCKNEAPCDTGRKLAARMTGIAHDHLTRSA